LIISDAHRFVFIHIPKCAGSSIVNRLTHLDPQAWRWVLVDGKLAEMDHPTLRQLQTYCPAEFSKVCEFDSFTIVRDPRRRFVSSLLYYMSALNKVELSRHSFGQVRAWGRMVCDKLPAEADAFEFRHFQRQCRYVFLDGQKIVRNVYLLEDMASLTAAIESRLGIRIDPRHRVNERRLGPAGPVKLLRDFTRPLYGRVVSKRGRDWLRTVFKPLISARADFLYRQLLEDPDLSRFIKKHYAEDFDLYHSLGGKKAG
jgi:hypothetical protein